MKDIDWFREAERLREVLAASRTVNKMIAKDNKRLEKKLEQLQAKIAKPKEAEDDK